MKNKYRFHLLGLAHLPCDPQYNACAYTMKNYKLAKMLLSLGHEVIYYGAEGSTVPCNTLVITHSLADIAADYGDGDTRFEIGYNFKDGCFREDFCTDPKKPSTQKFYANSTEYINAHKEPDDFLLLTQGWYQKPIHDATQLFLSCEPGIGYRGWYARFKAFESSFWRAYAQGCDTQKRCVDGHFYDRVIPNFFDDDDFEFCEIPGDYVLYVGRLIWRKGLTIAHEACEAAGIKLKIAGQGGSVVDNNFLSKVDNRVTWGPGNWEYIGYADPKERKTLFSEALATITPTIYMEPFAGTHVESMLSGTPVITSGFGVFGGETFIDGVHGFKCDTLNDFILAIKNADRLRRYPIRLWAKQFLMENVRWHYQRWFEDMYSVYSGKGWYELSVDPPEWWNNIYG